MIQVLIVDDEYLARQRIRSLIEQDVEIEIVGESTNGKEAIKDIETLQPDLVFLDIQMTDMTGFQVLEKIQVTTLPVIVFVTAYDEFAIKAFEVQALDFLLKPFKKDRFIQSLHRVKSFIQLREDSQYPQKIQALLDQMNKKENRELHDSKSYLEKIVIKRANKYYFVLTKEILYITSSAYYAEIYSTDGNKHVYRTSMNDLMDQLNPEVFSRIHRSSIVNIQFIREVVSAGGGEFDVVMKDGTELAVSKTYKKDFFEQIQLK